MNRLLSVFMLLLLPLAAVADDSLLTVAEKSGYRATMTNADVAAFCARLAAMSDKVRLTSLGTTAGGVDIPLLILGDPAPAGPAEMINDPRLVIYIQANIHAGEVEGKEGMLMLARDILAGKYPGILDHLVVLIVPNFNADGNDRIHPDNRAYQGGPEEGVGLRPNADNLDLNRDWIKLEAPETSAVVALLNAWDPVLLVDCHTTDGSLHEEVMTWAPQMHPSGDQAVLAYTRDSLIPAATAHIKQVYNYDTTPYGNFMDRNDPAKGWETFGHETRYTTNYMGMRNRLSVLLEAYAYATFKDRIQSTYGMVLGMLRHCAADRTEIQALITAADRRAAARAKALDPARDSLAVAVEMVAYDEPVLIRGYEGAEVVTDDKGRRKMIPKGKRIDWKIPFFGTFKVNRAVALPAAYAVPPGFRKALDKVRQHGVAVETLTEPLTLTIQRFYPTEMKSAEHLFQGHRFTSLAGAWKDEEVTLPAGTSIVRTGQPLGMLAAVLLEPESDDGLTAWNHFDAALAQQWGGRLMPHPVLRIMAPRPLPVRFDP